MYGDGTSFLISSNTAQILASGTWLASLALIQAVRYIRKSIAIYLDKIVLLNLSHRQEKPSNIPKVTKKNGNKFSWDSDLTCTLNKTEYWTMYVVKNIKVWRPFHWNHTLDVAFQYTENLTQVLII